ncbi:MAG: S41 family peptidase [Meiothermus ruber]|nr:S41 family peptidase [Meiothermus ruber]
MFGSFLLKLIVPTLLVASQVLAISPQAKSYLDNVLDLLETHYVRSDTINWTELRQKAYQLAANAQRPSDTYLAIEQVLAEIGEGHMYFIPAPQAGQGSEARTMYGGGLELRRAGNFIIRLTPGGPAQKAGLEIGDQIEMVNGRPLILPEELFSYRQGQTVELLVYRARTDQRKTVRLSLTEPLQPPKPTAWLLGQKFGYLDLPRHSLADARQLDYARQVQQAIRAVDAQMPCGWVVDLRNNAGGLFYSMLLGVGPLLGEGYVGGLVGPKSKEQWIYQDGKVLVRSGDATKVMVQLEQPYRLRTVNSPVAVLMGPETTSAGEALVIAFKGRPNTRFFGEPSYGFTTALRMFELPDGARIAIAVAFFADREGQPYDQQLEPDENLFTEWGFFQNEKDEVLQGALVWLQNQPVCRDARP